MHSHSHSRSNKPACLRTTRPAQSNQPTRLTNRPSTHLSIASKLPAATSPPPSPSHPVSHPTPLTTIHDQSSSDRPTRHLAVPQPQDASDNPPLPPPLSAPTCLARARFTRTSQGHAHTPLASRHDQKKMKVGPSPSVALAHLPPEIAVTRRPGAAWPVLHFGPLLSAQPRRYAPARRHHSHHRHRLS